MKKSVAKRKNNFKISNHYGKIFILSLMAFFVFVFIFANVNTSFTGNVITGQQTLDEQVANPIGKLFEGVGSEGGFFSDWASGKLDGKIMKYVFFVMITLFLVGVFGSASWPKGGFLRVLLSIFISYIGVGYILPEEFLAVAPFYSALVMAIVAGLPFIVLLLVSSQILQTRDENGRIVRGKLTVGKILTQFSFWIFYLAFLLWFTLRSFAQLITGTSVWTTTTTVFFIYMLVLVIGTASIVLFNGKFRSWIIRMGRDINREVSKDVEEAVRNAERIAGMDGPADRQG